MAETTDQTDGHGFERIAHLFSLIFHPARQLAWQGPIVPGTAKVITFDGQQAVKLPPEFAVSGSSLSIRKDGAAIILEPIKAAQWPEGFFEDIRIGDPAFCRPAQGQMPAVPELG